MTPSVTYLHLLRHTPFFSALSTKQLQWVIDYSREWKVNTGDIVATNEDQDDYWILLDGGWQLSHNQINHVFKHDSPGKWFCSSIATEQCELIATSPSYVMQITQMEMQNMINQRFAFIQHLKQGRDFYQTLFTSY
ncbi:MAG: hypothetical protein ABJN96_09120 [Marinomonas sp.]